MALSRL